MSLYDLDDDILVLIYNLLHTVGKISFVDAVHKLKRFSQLLRRLKQTPVRVNASESPYLQMYEPFNLNFSKRWKPNTEEFYSWVFIYQIPHLFELPMLFNLTFRITEYEDAQILLDILPWLNCNHVTYVNIEFAWQNYPIDRLIGPIIKHFSTLKPNNLPKVRFEINTKEVFKVPPKLPIERLSGDKLDISGMKHSENLKCLKLRNPIYLLTGNVPHDLAELEISFGDETTRQALNVLKKLISQNKNSLTRLSLDGFEFESFSEVIEQLKLVPNLKLVNTDFLFDLNEVKDTNIQEIVTGGLLTSSIFKNSKTNNTKGLKSIAIGQHVYDNIQLPVLLEQLRILRWVNKDVLIVPPNIKVLDLRYYGSEIVPIFPLCLEVFYLGENSLKRSPDFRKLARLHSLHIYLSEFYTLLAWPPNLRNLCINNFQRILDVVPFVPKFNEGLKTLFACSSSSKVPLTLRKFELIVPQTRNLVDTYKLSKFGDLESLYLYAPNRFVDLGPVRCSNLKYLHIESKFTSSNKSPIRLPSSLEILKLQSQAGGNLHLKFPSRCITNLQDLEISNWKVPFKYSYHSIGHGKCGTLHNRLKVICANFPPLFDSEKFTYPQKYILENKNNIEAEIFSYKDTPENLLQVITSKVTFLNRNLMNHLKRPSETPYRRRQDIKRTRTKV